MKPRPYFGTITSPAAIAERQAWWADREARRKERQDRHDRPHVVARRQRPSNRGVPVGAWTAREVDWQLRTIRGLTSAPAVDPEPLYAVMNVERVTAGYPPLPVPGPVLVRRAAWVLAQHETTPTDLDPDETDWNL